MRILLIEDDRALCTALLPALQAAGYTALSVYGELEPARPVLVGFELENDIVRPKRMIIPYLICDGSKIKFDRIFTD